MGGGVEGAGAGGEELCLGFAGASDAHIVEGVFGAQEGLVPLLFEAAETGLRARSAGLRRAGRGSGFGFGLEGRLGGRLDEWRGGGLGRGRRLGEEFGGGDAEAAEVEAESGLGQGVGESGLSGAAGGDDGAAVGGRDLSAGEGAGGLGEKESDGGRVLDEGSFDRAGGAKLEPVGVAVAVATAADGPAAALLPVGEGVVALTVGGCGATVVLG